ncbi:MAG: hypothetical protein NVS3B1_08740 [Marmoricola sp.]
MYAVLVPYSKATVVADPRGFAVPVTVRLPWCRDEALPVVTLGALGVGGVCGVVNVWSAPIVAPLAFFATARK